MASLCKNMRLARHGANYISRRLGSVPTFSSNRLLLTSPHQSSSARILAPRAFHNMAPRGEGIYLMVNTDAFSMFGKPEIYKIDTTVFYAGGYKWKLKIYNDYDGDDGKSVPIKIALADTRALPENWKLDADFSISLLDQAPRCYFSVFGRARFDARNTEWGGFFPRQLLSNPLRGYIKDGMCVLCADVEVLTENMSSKNVKLPQIPYKREFKIPNFPTQKEGGGWVSHKTWISEVFSAGGHNWMVKVTPEKWKKGIGRLSIHLENIVDSDNDDDDASDEEDFDDYSSDQDSYLDSDASSDMDYDDDIKASYTMTMKSQNGDHIKHSDSCYISASGGDQCGGRSFIDLATLYDHDKGFISNGCIHLELELSVEEEG